jgi:dephospho-CoA kinase
MTRPVIGLVGQVCAGKSAVAAALNRRGARVFHADRVVHELYETEDVKTEVRALLGDGVFGPDGRVDRRKVAEAVFADATKLEELTRRILFPRVGRRVAQEVAAFRGAGKGSDTALVLDAPTLFEAGNEAVCDRLLFVSAPRARREEWARAQRGWDAGELARRERHLLSEEAKRARCDAVVENDGTWADLEHQVAELWESWVEQDAEGATSSEKT